MKKVSSSCLILRGKILIIFLVLMVLAFALLFYSNAAVNGARRGIGYCLNILIPSLFPFMVLSTYLIKCGISEKLGIILEESLIFYLDFRDVLPLLF